MKLVEKPEGFELRDRRSNRSKSSEDWGIKDALYDASQDISKRDIDAVLVLYRERLEGGDSYVHFRFVGHPDSAARLLLSGMGKIMGWAP